ncbi:MAG: leucyl/phenylalanyl-tRNA--protein transferase [Halioglobus sp.]
MFPPSSEALNYPNGLLTVGGDLSPTRLIAAYRRGIFPWYDEEQPILWWTPDPRSVLFPEEFHISRSLRKTLRSNRFRLSVDRHFATVMQLCGELRDDGPGTWISAEMCAAYEQLHRLGIAHSIEVYSATDDLVGGLYGVTIGRAFFGESMFSLQSDASKVAMVGLLDVLRRGDFRLIDCQIESEHLNSLGARNINRLDFEALLAQTVDSEPQSGIWRLPDTCGELL